MGIVIAIIIFGLIVTVHEFGHFICAKLSGIKVLEFSVGMGPKLLQKTKGETKYSLRLLPLGGYCAMEGEDATNSDPRSFRNAKLWKRMVVLVAGAGMNFVLGFIAIVIYISMMDGVPTTTVSNFMRTEDDGVITYYAESYDTGLEKGDKIISVDGTRVYSIIDFNYVFNVMQEHEGHEVIVKRNGEKLKLDDVSFRIKDGSDKFVDFGVVYKNKNPLTVLKGSGENFMSMTHIIGLSLKQLFSGQVEKEEVSGPVGVVTVINDAAKDAENVKESIFNLFYMMALISINVGIFNLLPIPGLDGGRLLFCFIELVRRKPIKPEHEGYVHLAGMVLLFGIMIFATYNDIVKLITGGKNG
ncbi:regulator of sigma E protease [Ruminococcus flavefaciens]|uniref:Regulator of sigma E protease n=1 Tax=Ruminococcus flavefaciens TaxID=1265 RepID=A0A1H6JNL7_RUMFL|nr:site-2 protease family protein [Ruminococcus flavefaciens]SEH60633.1 regulator of sigma E protease [Ruminococcus flavefaciens]